MRRPTPVLGVALRVEAQRVQEEEPNDEEERMPRAAGEEAPARGHEWCGHEGVASEAAEPLAQDEILQDGLIWIATDGVENAGAHENALVAVAVPRQTIADAVEP